ncbi:MAG: Polynucleotide adenylyltransferase region [Gemmatimonadetes bacterium]|nr:Polynucleotide adenylyltransferase region [Gemmatimonadota bacterium]
MNKIAVPDEVLDIVRVLERAGFEAWCVGGAVRDALLDDPHMDYDIATSARPEEVLRLFPRTVPVGLRFGTVGVLDRRRQLHEVTTFRRDIATDGRHAVVQYGVSLEDDLARRDFTINALAYHPLREEWRDPFNGAADLTRRVVRAVGNPAQRFREDYLRILRGLRFSARLGFTIDPATWEAARAATDGLPQLSAERVRDEWFKSLRTARDINELVRLWRESGVAAAWMPELGPASEAAGVIEPGERDPVLLTCLLTSDPVAVLRRLKASNQEIGRAVALGEALPLPDRSDEVTVRRWLSRAGAAAGDHATLIRWRTGQRPAWALVAEHIRQRGDALTRDALAISGGDLRSIGLEPGPGMGMVLDRLLDRVLEDPTVNTREQLLSLAREV